MKTHILYIFLLLTFSAGSLLAEELIVKKNGVEIRGEIIAYENDVYLVQIGSFKKRIPANDIKEIRDLGMSTVQRMPQAPPPMPAAPANDASSALLQNLLKGGLPGAKAGAAPAGGGQSMAALQQLMQMQMKMKASGGGAPMNPKAIPMDMQNQLKMLQGNPAIEGLIGKFKNPAYQQKLLKDFAAAMKAMNPKSDPANNPQMKQIQQLLKQLNAAGQAGQSKK